MAEKTRTTHIFTVEMWRESSLDVSTPWRGLVKHVTHGQQRYFGTLGDLTAFIALRLDDPRDAIE